MTSSNELKDMRSRFRVVGWILLISVLLNMFLIGVCMGIVPHTRSKSLSPMLLTGPRGDFMMESMAQRLDPADANAFREAFKTQIEALKQGREHARQATGDLTGVFKQDQPNPTALQAALQKMLQARNELYEAGSKIMQTAYSKLSPDGRRRLVDQIPDKTQ